MDDLKLVLPDESLLAQVGDYKAEMLAAGSSMDGCGSLRRHTPEEWIDNCRRLHHEETCPPGWVPAIQYACVRETDGRLVGMIDLRLRFNAYLAEVGGHIGYSVRPDERRKGYAKRMLALALREAKRQGLQRVLITCLADNDASRRTIEANGGVFERLATEPESGEKLLRYWIAL